MAEQVPRIPESKVPDEILAIGKEIDRLLRERYGDAIASTIVNHDLSAGENPPRFCINITLIYGAPDPRCVHPPLTICPGAAYIDIWSWPMTTVPEGQDPQDSVAHLGYENPQFIDELFAIVDNYFNSEPPSVIDGEGIIRCPDCLNES